MKKLLLIFILSQTFSLCAKQQIILFSVPKCGTHLIKKCITLLTNQKWQRLEEKIPVPKFNPLNIVSRLKEINKQGAACDSHLWFKEAFIPVIMQPEHAVFFIYRDPRDQVVSMMYHLKKNNQYQKIIRNLYPHQIIADMLTEGKTYDGEWSKKNLKTLYDTFMPYRDVPGILSIRFEDLIGEQGGGSFEKQYKAIQTIAQHIEMEPTHEQIMYVIENLWGESTTFRKGKIGSWKEELTLEHIEAFKAVFPEEYLNELGYYWD